MKKSCIILSIGAIILFAAFNLNISSNEKTTSSLSLANIEALAQNENPIADTRSCHQTISMEGSGNPTHVTYCGSCDAQLARTWSNSGSCNHIYPL
ncbi:NVEALA domain-containing protein [Dysgonomonas reticulitermitis]